MWFLWSNLNVGQLGVAPQPKFFLSKGKALDYIYVLYVFCSILQNLQV